MYYVYVLKSTKHNFIYVGTTEDVQRRLGQHNGGFVQSTRFHTPLRLVYYEAFTDRRDALDREQELKHHGSVIGHLKRRLKYSLQSVEHAPVVEED